MRRRYQSARLCGTFCGALAVTMAPFASAQNQIWLRQFGTSTTDYASTFAPDGAGGVFVAGTMNGSLGGSNAGD